MNDGHRALAAVAFEKACVLLFSLLLQLPCMQHKQIRYAIGSTIASALLLFQPSMYATPTQPYGLALATFAMVASWSILHWTFLEPAASKPTVRQVYFSTITHPLDGVLKVHHRVTRKQQPQQQGCSSAQSSPNIWALLREAAVTMLVVHITCDIGLHLLCSLSNGMCSSSSSGGSGSWSAGGLLLAPATSRIPELSAQAPYLARCAFAFPAGILLTQQIEIMYGLIRLVMLLAGLKWQGLVDLAAQMPVRAFKWPVAASSVGELWAVRWHQTLRFYFQGLGGAAAELLVPSLAHKERSPKAVNAAVRCVAAFTMSGLAHEYLLWAVFGRMTGSHMAFFMLNCLAVLVESTAPVLGALVLRHWRGSSFRSLRSAACTGGSCEGHIQQQQQPTGQVARGTCTVTAHVTLSNGPIAPGAGKTCLGDAAASSEATAAAAAGKATGSSSGGGGLVVPVWLKHVWTLSFFIALGPLFVEPCRLSGFFDQRAFHPPWGAPVTPHAVAWVVDALSVAAA